MECSCPYCPVYKYIEDNHDLCLSVKTVSKDKYVSNIGICFGDDTPKDLINNLTNVLYGFMIKAKVNPKNLSITDSVSCSMIDKDTSRHHYCIQLLKRDKRVCLWKFCIHREVDDSGDPK